MLRRNRPLCRRHRLDVRIDTVELTLRSHPASEVSVDGRALGRTPRVTPVPRGAQSIDVVFSRAGAPPISKRITPDHAQTVEVRFPSAAKKDSAEGFIVPP